jgi:CTP:phosphocholine cytidylyltransferase-like protein
MVKLSFFLDDSLPSDVYKHILKTASQRQTTSEFYWEIVIKEEFKHLSLSTIFVMVLYEMKQPFSECSVTKLYQTMSQ